MLKDERPFRFGAQVNGTGNRHDWTELARKVETLGYSTLTMPDHFGDQLAPVPALQCAADATSTLRLGALVHDNDYKHPVVLAKEFATMDVLSDGRLEIGLGAGWQVTDYEQSGIPYDPPGLRVSRFIEGFAVIKGALGDTPFSFSGEHYTISEYDGAPKPIQSQPPVLIGGGGPRVLSFAARNADIVGINTTLAGGVINADTIASAMASSVDAKVDMVRVAALDADRLDDIELNLLTFAVSVSHDFGPMLTSFAEFANTTVEEVDASPFVLLGPVSKIVEDLISYRERWGISYFIVHQPEIAAFAPVIAALSGT
jgi:probable F420-dependent oxidoreductase